MKKKKIRVVSIILLASMFLSLLPAEQVFATASLTRLEMNPATLGFMSSPDVIVQIAHGDKSASVFVNDATGADNSKISLSSTFKLKGNKDSVTEVLNTYEFADGKTTAGSYICDDNDGDQATGGVVVRTGTPYSLSSFDSAFNVKFNEAMKGNTAVSSDMRSLGFKDGGHNVYAVHTVWADNKIEDFNDADTSSLWYYQSIYCDALTKEGVFLYTLVSYYSEEGGENNYATVMQKSVKSMHICGLVPFESPDNFVCKEIEEECARRIEEFLNSADAKDMFREDIQNTIYRNPSLVNKYTDEEFINADCEVNVLTKTIVEGNTIHGAEWFSDASPSATAGLAYTNAVLYDELRSNTLFGNIVKASSTKEGNALTIVATAYILTHCRERLGDAAKDKVGKEPVLHNGKQVKNDEDSKVSEDFLKNMDSSDSRGDGEGDEYTGYSDEDGNTCKITMGSRSVTKTEMAFNTVVTASIDDTKDDWADFIYESYCLHLGIVDAMKSGNKAFEFTTSSILVEKYDTHSRGPNDCSYSIHTVSSGINYTTTELLMFQDVLVALKAMIDQINYESDVGVKVHDLLSGAISEGILSVSYSPNTDASSKLDWKLLGEAETTGVKDLNVSTCNDMVYLSAYLYYLSLSENVDFEFNAIKITQDKGNVIYVAYPGGKLYEENCYGFDVFIDEEGSAHTYVEEIKSGVWTYYTTIDKFLTNNYLLTGMSPSGKDLIRRLSYAARISLTNNGDLSEEDISKFSSIFVSDTISSAPEDRQSDMLWGLDADDYDQTAQRIETTSDSNNYTGTVFGCLTDANHMYTYMTDLVRGKIGDNGLSPLPADQFYSAYVSMPYRRDDKLEGTKYSSDPNSKIDYVARLPFTESLVLPEVSYTILYNIDYAASVCDWSTYSESTGISAETMEEFLNSSSDAGKVADRLYSDLDNMFKSKNGNASMLAWAEAGVYDDMPEDYIVMFRSIISIYDICNTLAEADAYTFGTPLDVILERKESGELNGETIAKNWSPAIYKYYTVYKKHPDLFNAMRGNLLKVVGGDFSYSTSIEPLGFVINFEDKAISAQWKYGYALSSMYIPFETNLYEASAVEFMADKNNWVTEFFYKYGFYRKALYISTDPEAVVSKHIQGQQTGVKVATLRDLLNYQRDIELYVDQSFYNSKLLEAQLDRYIQNTGDNSMFGSIFDACNLTSDAILKTGGYSNYSSSVQQNVRPFNYEMTDEEEANIKEIFEYEDFILSEEEIVGADGMLSAYEYSIQQPYGLVSALYRHAKGYDYANMASVNNKPIFVSSKNASALGANNKELYRMFYNYMILSSLEATMSKETTLLVDLDAPIYTDLFGNIITSDGYVIIPAACNATLSGAYFKPYSIGFSVFVNNVNPEIYKDMTFDFYDFFYGINYASAIGKKNVSDYSPKFRSNQQMIGGGYFFLTQSGETTLGTTSLTDGMATTTVDWRNPNTNVAALKDLLFSVHYMNTSDMYNTTTVNLILEVLRGAPIEHIDVVAEGLETSRELTKLNATAAYMSEKLINSFQTNSNGTERSAKFSATLSVLDLFHIESAEKVALIAVKCLLVIFLILLAVQIVADASVGRMPIKTVWQTIVTCILTGTCIALLPVLTEFSLSTFTRMIMQQEASELLAFSTQRETDGTEIGVTQSYNTNSSTNIILHAGQLDVQWYDLLLYSVYSSVDDSFQDLYNKAADGMPLAEAPYTFTSGKEIYINVNKVMDTTVVQYNGELKLITNERAATKTDNDLTASYILPYYVFLDQLIANVNYYNEHNRVQPMNYSVNSDGSIRTHDMVYGYFHSEEFMSTDYDILDLYRILNVNSHKVSYCPYFTDDEVSTFMNSQWYPTSTNSDAIEKGINDLYAKAREYVMYNSSMLSYTTDAAFLKSMAMYLAVEYNSLFGVKTADAFELKCVDTKDLLRYVVGTPVDVYKYANRSFSRYAFENGGLASVCLATLLYCIFGLTNGMKVVAYVLTYITAIASIIYHRIFKREENYTTYGFFILIGEITVLNLVFAICFKVMMNLTRWGVPPIIAMLISIAMQILIIVGYTMIGINGAKNVKHLGQTEMAFFHNVMNHFSRSRSKSNESGEGTERTVAVLQAHDLTRRENDNFNEDRADPMDLMAHDRRRERGEIES